MRYCLNMIVKNESARITRALDSVAPYITAAVIADTGSTDNTKQVIVDWARAHSMPIRIVDVPFTDWGTTRNAALAATRTATAEHAVPLCDYLRRGILSSAA